MSTIFKIHDWNKLGAIVRQQRIQHGLSQAELAKVANVSRSWLARVEAGHRGAEFERTLRLLNALNINLLLSTTDSDGTQIDALQQQTLEDPAITPNQVTPQHYVDALNAAADVRRRAWNLPQRNDSDARS